MLTGVAPFCPQVYFVDHNNRTTQFTDPRLNAQILSSILRRQPPTTPSAAAPSTSTASTPPVPPTPVPAAAQSRSAAAAQSGSGNDGDLPQGLLNDSELLPKYRRDLVGKLRALRAELTAMQPQSGHCRLEVSRSEVFEESYRWVLVRLIRSGHSSTTPNSPLY